MLQFWNADNYHETYISTNTIVQRFLSEIFGYFSFSWLRYGDYLSHDSGNNKGGRNLGATPVLFK